MGIAHDALENYFFKSLDLSWAGVEGISEKFRNITPCLVEISESLLVADIPELKRRGEDCGGYPDFIKTGDVDPTLDSAAENFGAVEATGVDILGQNFFVSLISPEADEDRPDLIAGSFDDSLYEFHLAAGLGSGINALDVANGTIFAALKNSTGQLAIIDPKIHLSESPSLIATSTLPGVAGSRPEGWSIFYYDNRIYIGTRRTAGHEFHIFDVSDPHEPVWLGSREINHNINSIVVQSGLAFLATSGNARDLIVLDVLNPQAIFPVAEMDLPGNEDGRSLALLGKTLYLGRFKSPASSIHPDFYIIDISKIFDGEMPEILGSYTVFADINSISIQHDLAILGTSKIASNSSTLQILNIASTTNILPVATASTAQKITGVDYEDNRLMISIFGEPYFAMVNLMP